MTDLYARTYPLDGIEILSRGKGGDGRTVEAYAAVFDTPAEISDQHGRYREEIDRAAFNRTISHGIDRVGVFYHHGMTLHGTPSDLGSVPIARAVEVRADKRGLLTVSRYNGSALADAVLEAIRNGDITGYSFRGRIIRSVDSQGRPLSGRAPRIRGGELPLIRRVELGLAEYGPTPTPAYETAGVVAIRTAAELAADIGGLDGATRTELIRLLSGTPIAASPETADPERDSGAEDSRDAHSVRHNRIALALARLDATRKGIRNG